MKDQGPAVLWFGVGTSTWVFHIQVSALPRPQTIDRPGALLSLLLTRNPTLHLRSLLMKTKMFPQKVLLSTNQHFPSKALPNQLYCLARLGELSVWHLCLYKKGHLPLSHPEINRNFLINSSGYKIKPSVQNFWWCQWQMCLEIEIHPHAKGQDKVCPILTSHLNLMNHLQSEKRIYLSGALRPYEKCCTKAKYLYSTIDIHTHNYLSDSSIYFSWAFGLTYNIIQKIFFPQLHLFKYIIQAKDLV